MHGTSESPQIADDMVVRNLVRAAVFAALVGAFSYVSFPSPVSPVPVTLQVLGVFLAGIMLGPKWGGVALVLYLLAGALGAPIFSFGQAGPGVLFGDRAGFLLSFPIAAVLIGLIAHGGRSLSPIDDIHTIRLVGAMVGGTVVIYASGVTGLMFIRALAPWEAFVVGALAFIPAELIKMAAALAILRSDRLIAAST